MMDRRTFSTLLAGSVAAPGISSGFAWGQAVQVKTALYSGVGPQFTHYDIDVDGAALTQAQPP